MYDERLDEIIQKDESLKWLKKITDDGGIVVISPNAEKYKNDPNQLDLSGYSSKKTISRQFVIDVLSHEDSYERVKKIYEMGLYGVFVLFVTETGKFIDQYNLDRMNLVKMLEQINVNEFPSISEKYKFIMDSVSYEKFKEKTTNNNYEIDIDGKPYSIPVKLIYQFMDSNQESFDSILSNGSDFNGIPLDHFLYAVSEYYMVNNIEKNYLVNEELINRLKEIRSSEKVDVQMINKYLEADDPLLKDVKVNEELQEEILKGLPSDYSDLDKALYVYIKMCKKLTYDEEFYAINQKGPLSEKHKLIDNVSKITLTNNKVVCYEFDVIYAYILNKLGINYRHFIDLVNGYGDHEEEEFDEEFTKYSQSHTFLKFRCGKYLVKADSVTTILHGDIMQAKLNQPLKGLVCENTNEQSKKEFMEELNKVYTYIANQETKISQNEPEEIETFDEIVAQFANTTNKSKPIDIREKIEILINKVNSTQMIGIDAYSYLLQLRKILFTPQEREDNIKISIIRQSDETSAEALAIISLRLPDENGKMVVNRYIFKPGTRLIPISKEDLQTNFDNNTMGYVEKDDPIIPGIKI